MPASKQRMAATRRRLPRMRLSLLACLLPALVVRAPSAASVDAEDALLQHAQIRFSGRNGAPQEAAASDSEPAQWVVQWQGVDAEPRAWQRLSSAPSAELPPARITLRIDDRPPTGAIRFHPEALAAVAGAVIGPTYRAVADVSDHSGVSQTEWQLDGQPWSVQQRWPDNASGRPFQLTLVGTDRLGNRGPLEQRQVRLDAAPPQLRWQRLDRSDGVADDIIGRRPARIQLTLDDTLSGPAWLQTAGQRITADADTATELALALDIDSVALDWQAADRVGNLAQGQLAFRIDHQGPALAVEIDGVSRPLEDIRLAADRPFVLQAIDPLAGVAQACVEASIWWGECRPLPARVVGIAPGRYSLRLRAIDRLGNSSRGRYQIEVLP